MATSNILIFDKTGSQIITIPAGFYGQIEVNLWGAGGGAGGAGSTTTTSGGETYQVGEDSTTTTTVTDPGHWAYIPADTSLGTINLPPPNGLGTVDYVPPPMVTDQWWVRDVTTTTTTYSPVYSTTPIQQSSTADPVTKGAAGAYVRHIFAVKPGDIIEISVGSAGQSASNTGSNSSYEISMSLNKFEHEEHFSTPVSVAGSGGSAGLFPGGNGANSAGYYGLAGGGGGGGTGILLNGTVIAVAGGGGGSAGGFNHAAGLSGLGGGTLSNPQSTTTGGNGTGNSSGGGGGGAHGGKGGTGNTLSAATGGEGGESLGTIKLSPIGSDRVRSDSPYVPTANFGSGGYDGYALLVFSQNTKIYVKDSGQWKHTDGFTKVNGIWKPIVAGWTKINGQWKPLTGGTAIAPVPVTAPPPQSPPPPELPVVTCYWNPNPVKPFGTSWLYWNITGNWTKARWGYDMGTGRIAWAEGYFTPANNPGNNGGAQFGTSGLQFVGGAAGYLEVIGPGGTAYGYAEISAPGIHVPPVPVPTPVPTPTPIPTPPTTATIVPDTTSVNEGGTVTFTITTTNATNGTVMKWGTSGSVGATDFVDGLTQGSFTIQNNSATLTRQIYRDNLTEGVEFFIISISDINDNPLASSPTISVNDTSTSPRPTGSLTFNVGQHDWTVPEGVALVNVNLLGGSGGYGGPDGNHVGGVGIGGNQVSGSLTVTAGDILSFSVGGSGGNGYNGTSAAGGQGGYGAYGGGNGGASGHLGRSGSGGGGGGATVLYYNGQIVAAAGGGGGGGGAGLNSDGEAASTSRFSSGNGSGDAGAQPPGDSAGGGGGGGGFPRGQGGNYNPGDNGGNGGGSGANTASNPFSLSNALTAIQNGDGAATLNW